MTPASSIIAAKSFRQMALRISTCKVVSRRRFPFQTLGKISQLVETASGQFLSIRHTSSQQALAELDLPHQRPLGRLAFAVGRLVTLLPIGTLLLRRPVWLLCR